MSQDAPEGGRAELILFRSEDALTRIQVRPESGSVWLTQAQMAERFEVTLKTLSEHRQNIYDEGKVERGRTIRKLRIVQVEGEATRELKTLEKAHKKPVYRGRGMDEGKS